VKLISQILHKYRTALASDFLAYHNHCQRVYQYAITLLLMRESKKLAIAAAFHDLDIWTGKTMDYLDGSEALARKYLAEGDFEYLPDEVSFIIQQHHKLRHIKGNIEAEAFRKADLIDLTGGLIKFNLPKSLIIEAEQQFPREEFTKLITRKTLQHAWRHPGNPLPMVKW